MCMICSDWELKKMTDREAFSAIGEVLASEANEAARDHLFELSSKILDKTDPYNEQKEEFTEDLDYDPSTDN
jgi:hypothetical protein